MDRSSAFKLLSLALVVAALAACGRPSTPSARATMTQDEFNAATTKLSNNTTSVAKGAADNQAIAALQALPEGGPQGVMMSFTALGTTLLSPGMPSAIIGALDHGGPHLLRGIYEFQDTDGDGVADAWVQTGDSDELVLRWAFPNPDAASHNAELTIDWDVTQPTELVNDGMEVIEAPTDMSASLTVDGSQAASVAFDADWYDAPACSNPVLEPTSMALTGTLGSSQHRLDFDLRQTLGDGSAGIQGNVTATAGNDTAAISWDLNAQGSLSRGPDCFITDAQVSSGSVDVGLSSTVGGDEDNAGLTFDFDGVTTDEQGRPVSTDVSDGQVTINGQVAVTFAGTLDDANQNGVVGDNLIVTFQDGDTQSLESILENLSGILGSGSIMMPGTSR